MTRPLTTKGSGQADFTRTVANMDSVQRRLGTIDRSLHGTLPMKVMAGTIEALVGTLSYAKRLGTLGRMGTVAQVTYIPRMGTVGRLGTVPQVTYLPRVGTIGVGGGKGTLEYVKRMGTLGRMGTVAQVTYIPRLGTVGEGGGRGTIGYVRRMGTVGRMGSMPYLGRVGTIGRMGTTQVNIAAQDIMVGVDVQARFMSPLTIRDRVRIGPGSTWVGSWQHIGSYRHKMFTTYVAGAALVRAGSLFLVGGAVGTGVAGATGTFIARELKALQGGGPSAYGTHPFDIPLRYVRPIYRQTTSSGTLSVFLDRQA